MNFAAVARRFEAKHLQLTLALATDAQRFGDDCAAAYAGIGAYANRVTGTGLLPEHLERAVQFFSTREEDTKLETTSYASAELFEAIAARGFQLRFCTHVLARPVGNVARVAPPSDVIIERLDRTNEELIRAVAIHNEQCFKPPEPHPSPSVSEMSVALTSKHLRMETNDTFLARSRGEIVGVGCSESSHGVTLLFGGAVRPDFRGRGLQRALMNVRLAAANERGSELACVMTGPGTSSERNACRSGFTMVGTHLFFGRAR